MNVESVLQLLVLVATVIHDLWMGPLGDVIRNILQASNKEK